MAKSRNFLKKIEVYWEDSTSVSSWHNENEVDKEISTMGLVRTIGMYVKESDTVLAVCNSYDEGTKSFNAIMLIPKSCIKSRKWLK